MTTNDRENPPPYTPTPSFAAGESTLEHGPPRPFHSTTPAQSSAWPRLQHHVVTTPPPSLLRQLTNSFSNIVNQLDHPTRPAYPEQHQPSLRPPNHLNPMISSPRPPSSIFARDFYAAGTGPSPVPTSTGQAQPIPNPTPADGRPTTYPATGHPLINDGRVLVYPKGYKCDKCDNIGYKEADPSRPCRRCWNKYARPFSGPLAYSFSSNLSDGNFQRPLPTSVYRPTAFDPPGAFHMPPFPPQPTGFGPPPPIIHAFPPGPPPNAVVYTAGDPRIGGVLCWVCGGKGRINLLLLDINCEMCSGVGRTFQ